MSRLNLQILEKKVHQGKIPVHILGFNSAPLSKKRLSEKTKVPIEKIETLSKENGGKELYEHFVFSEKANAISAFDELKNFSPLELHLLNLNKEDFKVPISKSDIPAHKANHWILDMKERFEKINQSIQGYEDSKKVAKEVIEQSMLNEFEYYLPNIKVEFSIVFENSFGMDMSILVHISRVNQCRAINRIWTPNVITKDFANPMPNLTVNDFIKICRVLSDKYRIQVILNEDFFE